MSDRITPESSEPSTGRVSFERLRERTDELELIISGLSLLALVSLPGLIWEAFETFYARMPLGMVAAVVVLIPILSAICYVMAALFLIHLGVRAHWVGLIGLKAVSPEGIRWERLQGIGRITLDRLKARLPDIDDAIIRADVLASTLFALITFSAMSLAMLGFWMALLFAVAGVFGNDLGGTNTFINIAITALFFVFLLAPALRWLLDGVLARRIPKLHDIAVFRGLVRAIGLVESLLLPTRPLGLPRYALQSQLAPRAFFVVFVVCIWVVVIGSNQWFQSGRGFDVFRSQYFAPDDALGAAHGSRHYESQRIARDRARPVPMIPAPIIETAYLPVFLPYITVADDPVLKQRCPQRTDQAPADPSAAAADFFSNVDTTAQADERDRLAAARTREASACLATLWAIQLDGKAQSLDGFVLSERADLGVRGLTGYLPLNGLAAGPHTLEVLWRPQPEQDTIAEDYVPKRVRHVIPFVWSPEAAAIPAGP